VSVRGTDDVVGPADTLLNRRTSMVRLYTRDAVVVTEALRLLVELRSDPNAVDAFNRLQNWEPTDVDEVYPPEFAHDRRSVLAVARLKSILAAIDEQSIDEQSEDDDR
jgi:hypothetical protein